MGANPSTPIRCSRTDEFDVDLALDVDQALDQVRRCALGVASASTQSRYSWGSAASSSEDSGRCMGHTYSWVTTSSEESGAGTVTWTRSDDTTDSYQLQAVLGVSRSEPITLARQNAGLPIGKRSSRTAMFTEENGHACFRLRSRTVSFPVDL